MRSQAKPKTERIIMSNSSPLNLIRSTSAFVSPARLFLAMMLMAGSVVSLHAQGQLPSGTVSSTGSGPYTYSLTFSNAASATSPVGSVWYAWIPGHFYLPGVPTSAAAPAGWTATVSSDSVQFVASSSANDILAGQSLSGFGYQATFTPAQLAAAPNSGLSDAYSAGLFSDSGVTFTVQAAVVPEPSAWMLFFSGAVGLCLMVRRRFQT